MTSPEKQSRVQANEAVFQYNQWRKTFLATVLRVVAGLGLLLYVTNIPSLNTFEIIVFAAVYIAILGAAFIPLPYTLKAGVLIASIYFVGMYALLQEGPWSGASAFLLGTTLFATLLFDSFVDRWVLALNFVTILLVGSLNETGVITLASIELPSTGLLDWLTYTADYFVLSLALIWAINLLKTEFRSIADKFQLMIGSLSRDRIDLEMRVEERTSGLVKKTDQLRAAAFIARQTAEIQQLDTILKMVVKLITDQFGFYHSGIFLLNETGDEVVLVSASSEGGRRMLEKGHSLRVGAQGIVGYAAALKKPRIALDVGSDAIYFNNPDLPETRSEIALPMLIRDKVLGVLDIQSDQPSEFSIEEIDVLQTLADQVAVAIENARLLEESQVAIKQIEALTAVRTREAWSHLTQEGSLSYTYTPLGIRSGKEPEGPEKSLTIPITLRGQKIGSISISRKDNTPWNDLDRDMIAEVANQTGLAIDNVRLVEEATQRARQEQTIGELAARFSQSMDIDALLQTAARELGQMADVAEVSVFIGDIPEQTMPKRRTRRSTGLLK